jgi:hypothetical protein
LRAAVTTTATPGMVNLGFTIAGQRLPGAGMPRQP